jgi:hypothetical protein
MHSGQEWIEVPFIDRLGRYTGRSIFRWRARVTDVFATTVSTIASRLLRYASKHNHSKVVGRHRRLILRSAAYYALSKNSYYMDRFLYFLRGLGERSRPAHAALVSNIVKLDANKRFVYSQACYQANWLLTRALKPRDKSKLKFKDLTTVPNSRAGDRGRVVTKEQVTCDVCFKALQIGCSNMVIAVPRRKA